jgi:hypothetical protein
MDLLPDLVGGVGHGTKRTRGGGVADYRGCGGVLVDAARERRIGGLLVKGDHRREGHGLVDGRAGGRLAGVGGLGHWISFEGE